MVQNEVVIRNISETLKFISSEKLFIISDRKSDTSAYKESNLIFIVIFIVMINLSLFTFIGIIKK